MYIYVYICIYKYLIDSKTSENTTFFNITIKHFEYKFIFMPTL